MVTVVHIPLNDLPRIDAVWMIVSVDKNGKEGVVATPAEGVGSMPLIVAAERLVPLIEKAARSLSEFSGMKMRLVKFTNREVMKEIGND